MKTRHILSVLMLAAATAAQAQDMTIKSFKASETSTIAATMPRLDFNEKACAVVRVVIKPKPAEEVAFIGNVVGDCKWNDGDQSYWVYMPDGQTELTVAVPSIGRARVDFSKYGVKRIHTKQTYTLEINQAEPRRTLVMAEGALGASQAAFGVMVGMVQKHGGYLHGRFDFGSAPTTLKCNDDGVLSGGDFDGQTPFYNEGTKKKSRFSITAGYIYRLSKPIYGFVGLGYGQRTLAWQTTDGEWAKNTDHSASGIAAEIGGILRFGRVGISLSYQTIKFKYHEAGLGLGLFF